MTRPLSIAVVSGKGGVGKTMLSVAIANEMARGERTLLIDLDFFNRGLTGLFATPVANSPSQPVRPPEGLIGTVGGEDWQIANVQGNLFVLSYGDVAKASSTALEAMDVHELARRLGDYVAYLREAAQCEVVILDCHGGPDNMSFAACLLAQHSILVSEPDKITLYGTLNFLRTLESMGADPLPDIRLVFNKVIPAFSARFLFSFYSRYLARQFGGHRLLAIYPMEQYLTKAFEKTPYLTTVYPTSQLAVKTRLLLYELLSPDVPELLPRAFRHPGRWARLYHRYAMGRWPIILDLDFIFRLIAIAAIVLTVVPLLAAYANRAVPAPMFAALAELGNVAAVAVITGLVLWLLTAVLLRWAHDLDVFLTFKFRTRAPIGAVVGCVTLLALCLPLGVGAGIWASYLGHGLVAHTSAASSSAVKPDAGKLAIMALGAAVQLALLGVLLHYAWRGVRNIRFDRHVFEGSFRIGLVLALFGMIGILASIP